MTMWGRASLFRQFTDTNVRGPVPLKYGKLATKSPWIYGYFFTVYKNKRPSYDAANAFYAEIHPYLI